MTIAIDANGTATCADQGSGGHNFSGTITIGALTNGIMVVCLNNYGTTTDVRLDTSGGAQFTSLGAKVSQYTNENAEIWYLLNPPSGAHGIYVNGSYVCGGAVLSSWSGVSQATPFGAAASNVFGVASISLNAACVTGSVAIDAIGRSHADAAKTKDAAQTTLGADVGINGYGNIQASYKQSDTNTTMAWTGGATSSVGYAAALNPAAAAGAGVVPRWHLIGEQTKLIGAGGLVG